MPERLLTAAEREQLERIAADGAHPARGRQARILLAYDDGLPTREVAAQVGLSPGRVRKVRHRFSVQRLAVFVRRAGQGSRGIGEAEAAAASAAGTSAGAAQESAAGPETAAAEVGVQAPSAHAPSVQAPLAQAQTPSAPEPALAGPLRPKRAKNRPAKQVAPALPAELSAPPEPAQPASLPARRAPGVFVLEAVLELARTLKAPGVEPDDPLVEAGRKVLRFHFLQMLRHEAGTRLGEDIEELHDMRVATRRMRAAFDIFGQAFAPKTLKANLKGLRATGRSLGRVRDLDVFMEKAGHYLERLPEPQRHGLDPLLDAWKEECTAARAAMVAHLDSPQYAAFRGSFYTFLSTPGAGVRKEPEADGSVVGHALPGGFLARDAAPLLIYTSLAGVRSFEPQLNSASVEQLHALRIEFKKFRYTVEFFREILGPEIKEVIEDLKCMQDHLGDLNDAQVAVQLLQSFLAGWDSRQAGLDVRALQNPEPVVAYLAYQHAERHRLRVTFGEAWAHFARPEFRKNVAEAISVL